MCPPSFSSPTCPETERRNGETARYHWNPPENPPENPGEGGTATGGAAVAQSRPDFGIKNKIWGELD